MDQINHREGYLATQRMIHLITKAVEDDSDATPEFREAILHVAEGLSSSVKRSDGHNLLDHERAGMRKFKRAVREALSSEAKDVDAPKLLGILEDSFAALHARLSHQPKQPTSWQPERYTKLDEPVEKKKPSDAETAAPDAGDRTELDHLMQAAMAGMPDISGQELTKQHFDGIDREPYTGQGKRKRDEGE